MKHYVKVVGSLVCALLLVFTFFPVGTLLAEAEEPEGTGPKVDISVDGKTYENISDKTVVLIKDIDAVVIHILSVNGKSLTNVGTDSGVVDSEGRPVLEVNKDKAGEGVWTVRLCYHDEDDPDTSNHGAGFEIVGMQFKTSADAKIATPDKAAVKNVKAVKKGTSIRISWKTAKGAYYQIQCATSKKALDQAKMVKVAKGKTSYTIKKLKAKKTYYVRIRKVTKYNDTLGNTFEAEGKWKTVKVKL
jgi:hypothetical protein